MPNWWVFFYKYLLYPQVRTHVYSLVYAHVRGITPLSSPTYPWRNGLISITPGYPPKPF